MDAAKLSEHAIVVRVPPDLTEISFGELAASIVPGQPMTLSARDLRRTNTYGLIALKWLVSVQQRTGASVNVELPSHDRMRTRLLASGVLSDLRTVGESERRLSLAFDGVPVTTLATSDDVEEFAAAVNGAIRGRLPHHAFRLTEVAAELGENAVRHGRSPHGALAMLGLWKRGLEIVIIDEGGGFASSVSKAQGVSFSHRQALHHVMVSRKPPIGLGLGSLIETLRRWPGSTLMLQSGAAALLLAAASSPMSIELSWHAPGTWAVFRLPALG